MQICIQRYHYFNIFINIYSGLSVISLLYNVESGIFGVLSVILTIAFLIGAPVGSTNLSLIVISFIFLSITTSNVIGNVDLDGQLI